MHTTPSSIVPFAPPSLGSQEIAEVVAKLESGWLTTGPRVASFERVFASLRPPSRGHARVARACSQRRAEDCRRCGALRGRRDRRTASRIDWRLHLFQFLRDEEPDDRRGRHGHDRRRAGRVVHADSRDTLHARLRAHGISTSVHFRAVHLHPFYQGRFGFRRGMFPVAESVSDTTLVAAAVGRDDRRGDRSSH